MKNTYVKVVVSGLPKTGKTTIAEAIGDALSELGFDVTMETDADDDALPPGAVQKLAASGLRVLVQERDARLEPRRSKRQQASQAPAENPFPGVDQTLSCIQCGGEFIFSAGQQQWFLSKNLHTTPRRCKPCISKRAKNAHPPG